MNHVLVVVVDQARSFLLKINYILYKTLQASFWQVHVCPPLLSWKTFETKLRIWNGKRQKRKIIKRKNWCSASDQILQRTTCRRRRRRRRWRPWQWNFQRKLQERERVTKYERNEIRDTQNKRIRKKHWQWDFPRNIHEKEIKWERKSKKEMWKIEIIERKRRFNFEVFDVLALLIIILIGLHWTT